MLKRKLMTWSMGLTLVWAGRTAPAQSRPAEPVIEESLEISRVWAGHPVEFALLTTGGRQFVAYYDSDRRMMVAGRKLGEPQWVYRELPSKVVWDSHNYITMAVDAHGHLHLAGNMHNVPLIYFRTSKPHDITTFERVPALIGRDEQRATYPVFFTGAGGELIFQYRDGSSGNGRYIYNAYDAGSNQWRRLLDQPLIDGEGRRGAYPDNLVRDKQGVFHLCWVWRDTGDCSTNHDICYARSGDLVHWETSDGSAIVLPMTLSNAEYVVKIPVRGGLINGNARMGFDAADRPIISYHKFDEAGLTQAYVARKEDDHWVSRQVSRWDYRWYFEGGGAIEAEIGIGPVQTDAGGRLLMSFRHPRAGRGRWVLDPGTLAVLETLPAQRELPAALGKVESNTPGMKVQWAEDAGSPGEPGVQYRLRWETLPANRDRPRPGEPPPPSVLRVLKVRRPSDRAPG